MKHYPILFEYRDLIRGNGFVADITVHGRALLSVEPDGDTWLYGVRPGAVAGGDPQRAAAFRIFKENYLSVLFHFAAEAGSFRDFKKSVERFFNEANEICEREWESALAEVRRRNVASADLPTVQAAQRPPVVRVALVVPARSKPSANVLDSISRAT